MVRFLDMTSQVTPETRAPPHPDSCNIAVSQPWAPALLAIPGNFLAKEVITKA